MTGGMTNPDYRLPTANRMTVTNVIAGLEDLMYTIAASKEERDNPHRNAEVPPMPQPVPDRDLTWHARPFVERVIPAPPQENRLVGRERTMADVPLFDAQPITQRAEAVINFEVQVEQGAVAMRGGAAAEEHARQVIDWMQMDRDAEQARVDALANRTRGIPNRR